MKLIYRLILGLALLPLILPASLQPPPPVSYAEAATGALIAQEEPPLIPLPRGCGDGLPPGAEGTACCMVGYVIVDGRPVADARVVVVNLRTWASLELWSKPGPDSDQPYVQVNLSSAPLELLPGDELFIYAAYGGRSVEVWHTVLAGSQHLDLVIPSRPGSAERDYVPDQIIYAQPPLNQFNPYRPDLVIDGSDTLYLTDWGNARVLAFTLDGTALLGWGSLGDAEGTFISPSGLAVDGLGNLFVSDFGAHRISVFSRLGEFRTRWGSAGSGESELIWPSDLTVGPDGNLYVADTGNHRVQVFRGDGTPLRRFGSEGNGPDQLRYPAGLAFGPDGNLYVADTNNRRIQVFTPAGLPVRSFTGAGQFVAPTKLTFSPQGILLVVDHEAGRIYQLDQQGTLLNPLGSPGTAPGQLSGPGGLAFSQDGRLFVADGGNGRVQIFNQAGTLVGRWGQLGDSRDRVISVGGIARSPDGTLFASDLATAQIKVFDQAGQRLRAFGGFGTAPGQLLAPVGLALAPDGSLYVADSANHRIQQFTATGTLIRSFGSFGSGNGQFHSPQAVAVAPDGQVFVADTDNHRIQQFTANGTFVRAFGSQGSAPGQFESPFGLAVGPDGKLFVVDTGNHRIQQFSATGSLIGSWGQFGYAAGQLAEPMGIAVGPDGSVYVAEYASYRFQRFTPDGTLLQLYGAASAGPGGVHQPVAIVVEADGAVTLAERNLGRIQRFRPASYDRPIATIVAVTPRIVVAGQAIKLLGRASPSVEPAASFSFAWFLGDASTPFATTPEATLLTTSLAPGEYPVTLVVTDAAGRRSPVRQVTISVVRSADPVPLPQSWTMLLYLAGDNARLTPYLDDNSALGAIFRLRNAPAPVNVKVAILFDGDQPGGGDSFRYLLIPGQPAQIEALGEVNTGDPRTLSDFIVWGREVAPAEAYYLAIADHGNALDGIAWDVTSDRQLGARLTPGGLRQALVEATEGGTRPINILHLDACLMGLLETAYQLGGLADYLIVSQNLAWSSFDYATYRQQLRPGLTVPKQAQSIADAYATRMTRAQVPYTISVLDLAQLTPTVRAVDELAEALLRFTLADPAHRQRLQHLRDQVQKFDSSGDGLITAQDSYVDLDHFAELISTQLEDALARAAAERVRNNLRRLVILNRQQSGQLATADPAVTLPVVLANARGTAIYLPSLPSLRITQDYLYGLRFTADTRWDEWLQAQLVALGPTQAAPPLNPIAPRSLPPERTYLPVIRR